MRTLFLILVALSPSFSSPASAQVELTGTYIRYFGVGSSGIFINSASHSLQYTESGLTPYSCDTFFPGTPVESFIVSATAGVTAFDHAATYTSTSLTTTSGPTLAGRTITWNGSATSGTASMSISQTVSYALADRAATVTVTLTNTSLTDMTEVYYLRTGDPDFGQCSIGTEYATTNDVLRQPPLASNALVSASEAGLTLAMGANDTRARAHVGSGLDVTDPATVWAAPFDPGGTRTDVGIALVFREPTLRAGASTTFTFYYVWGTSTTDVTARFDAVSGCGAEGGACTSGGIAGTCRAGRCCTGCFDGVTCQTGTAVTACGRGGGTCASCDDFNVCTTDRCDAGACSSGPAPAGTTCDDARFCTTDDRCSGITCTGTTRSCDDGDLCTSDRCDEPGRRCVNDRSGGCSIAGMCVGSGVANPANPCQVCNPALSTSAWSAQPSGTTCGGPVCAGGALSSAQLCNEGACVRGESTPCPSGVCASETECLAPGADAGPRPDGGLVESDGGARPDAGPIVGPGPTGRRRGGCSTTGDSFPLLSVALLALGLAWRRRRTR
jgi:uncharacterized protein (TIGR03382 family)